MDLDSTISMNDSEIDSDGADDRGTVGCDLLFYYSTDRKYGTMLHSSFHDTNDYCGEKLSKYARVVYATKHG